MTSLSTKTNVIGPQLPPGIKQPKQDYIKPDDDFIGPALPTSIGPALTPASTCDSIGPAFPENIIRRTESEDDNDIFGPVLPPGMGQKTETLGRDVIGPALPPSMTVSEGADAMGPALPPHMRKKCIGPSLPSQFVPVPTNISPSYSDDSSDNDDDNIGPKLSEAADAEVQNQCTAAVDFERRAEKMKNQILGKDSDVKKREEWMTELPSRLGPQIGLGARSFKKQAYAGNDDRSEWTDTPADRKRKAELGNEQEQGPSAADIALHRRNEEIADNLNMYNKSKRKESLYDMHQKKRKEKKEKTKPERREFDRDKDLNIQNVDAAQAKSFIDKAKLLGGKFSHGASHFL